MNRAIRVVEVRVVNEDGQQLGVMATDAARDVASRLGLDLVEISPTARPPVCKIMDYGRYKYELKKKAAVAKKTQHQTQVKEIKLRPRTSDHDLDFKLRNARRFLIDGDKVKCTVMFRGREIVHTRVGRELLVRVAKELESIAAPESNPQMEGRTLSFTLAANRAAIDKLKAQDESKRLREEQEAAKAEAQEKQESAGAEAPAEQEAPPVESAAEETENTEEGADRA